MTLPQHSGIGVPGMAAAACAPRPGKTLWDQGWERLPAALFACDRTGRIVGHTPLAARIWGRKPRLADPEERYCGAHRLLRGGRPITRDQGPMGEALRTGEPVSGMELTLERADGTRRVVRMGADPVYSADRRLLGALGFLEDITDLARQREALAARERWYRDLLDALPAAIYTTDRDGRLTFYNQAAAAFSGRQPALGDDSWCVTWRLYHPDGRPLPHEECPMAVALKEERAVRGAEAIAERPDGTRVPFAPYPTPLRDASGAVSGAVNMLVDISERKQAERRQRALLDEVNHRVKNTLATVQSLARLTLRGADVSAEASNAFVGRLMALSSVHNQLAREQWESAELGALLRDVAAPYEDEAGPRLELTGPPVRVTGKIALTLALVVHELATNARKFGALSRPGGAVALDWQVIGNGERRLRLEWRETGGPPVAPPARRGLGSRLLEQTVARELKGQVELSFPSSGVCCSLDIPLASLTT